MEAKITVIDFDKDKYSEKTASFPKECFPYLETPTTTWINVDGLVPEVIEELALHFGLHPLVLRDILNPSRRPKLEDFGSHLFFIGKMLYYDEGKRKIVAEQISIVVGKNFVLSFQQREGDVFEPIRERLRTSAGVIRSKGSDYLAYCMMASIVDNYFTVLERLGEEIEDLEEHLVRFASQGTLRSIHRLKKEVLTVRRAVWPLREVFSWVERLESPLIHPDTRHYLRDLYEHSVQVIETVETYREMLSGMVDIYLSSLNNRMNEIMKVLTIIGTIFLPLSFITGIYGMNFVYMPELAWKWSYFVVLGIMGIIALGMLLYFKKKKWL